MSHVDRCEAVQKAYILLGPCQPKLKSYKLSQHGKQKWAFKYECFEENAQYHAFTVDGQRTWKSKNILKQHVSSINDPHHEAMEKWHSLRNLATQLERVFVKQTKKEVEHNRYKLKATIESLRLLANKGQAFRGHNESEGSLNAGNFQQVRKSYGRMATDDHRAILESGHGNAKYTPPLIQKQLLNFLGNRVRQKIREEVEIVKVLGMFNLQVENICGQGYDGVSNMSGIWNGLQALFLEDCMYAYYIHCFAHRLQLALNGAAKCCHDTCHFFSTLVMIVNFVDSSAKRKGELKYVQEDEIQDLIALGTLQTEMRDDGWNDFVAALTTFCETHIIDMPDMSALYLDGTGRPCQQKSFITIEHHFCIEVFNVVLDFQLSELNKRFNERSYELLMLTSNLDPHNKFSLFESEKDDFLTLELECAYYKKHIIEDVAFHNLDSISDLCRKLVQTRKLEFFPMIFRLICLVLTLHVSTATTERAFSSMNIIKNKLRNKIEDDFLDDCTVFHIENEFAEAVDNEAVIKDFENLGPRRVKFS
ncbi:uncharacterized protein LOC126787237 [Argentina anserina]|uniref:uncharacterized protein LOC126787237 n=1 Tax=Argentina anserina TaxID=57926 RepID=UPI00217641CA|nr:uncharacterized protein LOC126787237 [Potentilla anserina]